EGSPYVPVHLDASV
nr:Chain B, RIBONUCLEASE A [synthetic construct]